MIDAVFSQKRGDNLNKVCKPYLGEIFFLELFPSTRAERG